MEDIEFRCLNCGARVERELLPGKHTILGSIPVVNKQASCCDQPEYEDLKGYHRSRMEKASLRGMVPGIA